MLKNNFTSRADICESFGIDRFDGTVVYADYDYQNYEGDAAVVYVDDGKLFMVSSSHCSCNGLDDTWNPDEVTMDMLRVMADNSYGKDQEAAQYIVAKAAELGTDDPDAIAGALTLLGEAA